jgi:hypothetical protein
MTVYAHTLEDNILEMPVCLTRLIFSVRSQTPNTFFNLTDDSLCISCSLILQKKEKNEVFVCLR